MKKIIYILALVILPNLLSAQTERKIGDRSLKGYIIDKLHHESKSDGMKKEDQQKLINSINKIIKKDLKPIIEGIKY